jgi:hypothetical protein
VGRGVARNERDGSRSAPREMFNIGHLKNRPYFDVVKVFVIDHIERPTPD